MNAAGIPWAVYGDFMLSLKGISCAWHTFEVMTDEASMAAADKILTRLGMRHETPDGSSAFCCEYHFDGADIRLVCGPAGMQDGRLVHLAMGRNAVSETIPVLGVPVPLLNPMYALVYALLQERDGEAVKIQPLVNMEQATVDDFGGTTVEELPAHCVTKLKCMLEET